MALALALVPEESEDLPGPRIRIVPDDGREAPGPLDLIDWHARLLAAFEGDVPYRNGSTHSNSPRTLAVDLTAGLRLEWDVVADDPSRGAR